jgi:hypothetical protein
MPNDRAFVAGGCRFFTANLPDHRNALLTKENPRPCWAGEFEAAGEFGGTS